MEDTNAINSAVNGLSEVTSILASYSFAENEFLASTLTRQDFGLIVIDLYTAIFQYEALAAQYFARSTLNRLGHNVSSKTSWEDSVNRVRNLERRCHIGISSLSTRLSRQGFQPSA